MRSFIAAAANFARRLRLGDPKGRPVDTPLAEAPKSDLPDIAKPKKRRKIKAKLAIAKPLQTAKTAELTTNNLKILEYLDRTAGTSAVGLGGTAGWAFLHGDSNSFLYYYFGLRGWSKPQAKNARRTITSRATLLQNDLGCQYAKFIVPEKPPIYPEYLPEEIKEYPASAYRPALMMSHGTVPAYYLADALIDAKPLGQMYFRGDSHPSWAGSYVIYRKILQILHDQHGIDCGKPKFSNEFQANVLDFGGDLASKPGHQGWSTDAYLLSPLPLFERVVRLKLRAPSAVRVKTEYEERMGHRTFAYEVPDSNLPKAVIFHDSTAALVIEPLVEHFSRSVFFWRRGEIYLDVVRREKPDIVIQIMAERFVTAYPVKTFRRLWTGWAPDGSTISAEKQSLSVDDKDLIDGEDDPIDAGEEAVLLSAELTEWIDESNKELDELIDELAKGNTGLVERSDALSDEHSEQENGSSAPPRGDNR